MSVKAVLGLSTLAGLSRRNLSQDRILLLFLI